MSKIDPTSTLTLRNKAIAECNARFQRVARAVRQALSLGDYTGIQIAPLIITNAAKKKAVGGRGSISRRRAALGLKMPIISGPPSPLGPADISNQYVFQRNEGNIAAFDVWLSALINAEILQPTVPLEQKWLSSHLGVGYSRGATTSHNRIKSQAAAKGVNLPPDSPFLNPHHVDRSRLIYTRAFNDLEGVTDLMKSEMRKVLADGIIRGQNPKEVAKALDSRIQVGRVRANRIARTEIVEAHQEASIAETELMEQETGLIFDMEWSTCKDGRERDTHRARDGKVYTKEKARSMLGEPNCRCGIFPHIRV